MISGLCRKSSLFEKLSANCRPFLRGAHWDGLHCTQDQEADAYLVLDVRMRMIKENISTSPKIVSSFEMWITRRVFYSGPALSSPTLPTLSSIINRAPGISETSVSVWVTHGERTI